MDDSSSVSEVSVTLPGEGAGQTEGSCIKKRKVKRYEHYVSGTTRSVYQLRSADLKNAMNLSPTVEGVCSACASGLAGVSRGFFNLRQQGTELRKTKARLPIPKHSDRQHYRDINAQNEWLRGNVFDSMGNYMFCHSCIK